MDVWLLVCMQKYVYIYIYIYIYMCFMCLFVGPHVYNARMFIETPAFMRMQIYISTHTYLYNTHKIYMQTGI